MQRSTSLALGIPLLWLALGCSDAGGQVPATGGAPAGTGGSAAPGTGGSVAPPVGGGGTSSSSSSGTGGTGSPTVILAGSGQALGGGDQGALFEMGVEVMPPEMGGAATGGSGGGSGIPGDGKSATSMIRGAINGTAVFKQTGEDVEVIVGLTNCPDGNHQLRIHDGYSCDNASTEGVPWGPRGTGIGPASGIACSGGKGMLTYTRSGSDKTKNWTVGDHAPETDVTAHVLILSDEKDPNSRASCGNFF
jgi:hypothetical protein